METISTEFLLCARPGLDFYILYLLGSLQQCYEILSQSAAYNLEVMSLTMTLTCLNPLMALKVGFGPPAQKPSSFALSPSPPSVHQFLAVSQVLRCACSFPKQGPCIKSPSALNIHPYHSLTPWLHFLREVLLNPDPKFKSYCQTSPSVLHFFLAHVKPLIQ